MEPAAAFALFVDNVKRLLAESGLSRKQLAEKMNVKPPHITRMLKSEEQRQPNLETLAKLAGAFGVSIDELLKPLPVPGKKPKKKLVKVKILDGNHAGKRGWMHEAELKD